MNNATLGVVVLFGLSVALGVIAGRRYVTQSNRLSHSDIEAAHRISLGFNPAEAKDLTREEFENVRDRIYAAQIPEENLKIEKYKSSVDRREEYSYYYDWPKWKYVVDGAPSAWPANLYSRFYMWYPSFNTSGYTWWIRPGVYDTLRQPFGRWVHHNSHYYYVA